TSPANKKEPPALATSGTRLGFRGLAQTPPHRPWPDSGGNGCRERTPDRAERYPRGSPPAKSRGECRSTAPLPDWPPQIGTRRHRPPRLAPAEDPVIAGK